MSSKRLAVEARGLSKAYTLTHTAMREKGTVVDYAANAFKRRRPSSEQFWALRDASFELGQGEVLGIIGHNGAGKSTLMKILSRIVEPTSGEAFLRGRIGSLLEVGTGFHPDLTGRENIFLNGSMLGMARSVVKRQFDDIVEFSGVERFLDTPVKRYSSGMYVRLAFAVAAHLECDVLIVDEVLAVGDEAFQQKCLGQMSEVAGQGRTVLFVSHNMSAITALAPRTIVVARGHIVFDGATGAAIDRYLGESSAESERYVAEPRPDAPTITRVELRTSEGGRVQAHGSPLDVCIEVKQPGAVNGARLYVTLVNRLGRWCSQAWRFDSDTPMCREAGTHQFHCRFPNLRLAPGQYGLLVTFADRDGGTRDEVDRVCPFEVVMYREIREGGWPVNQVACFDEVEWSEGERT
jgi:lipopolysaccharide transport system ATP-binding protein